MTHNEKFSGPIEGARAGIIEALGGANASPTPQQVLESYGYKLATRREFDRADDLPDGLLQRATAHPGGFVVYDPDDDADGWLLVGDDPAALAAETVEALELGRA